MQTEVVTPIVPSLQATLLPVMPKLGEFLDYRKYLAAYYQFKRDLTRNDLRPYSYAVFSAAADIKSPNYLKMIIDGRRNLSPDMILKFAKAMGMNKEQTEQWKALVEFTQSSDPMQRNLYLKELTELRVNSQLKSGAIDAKAWEKVPSWVTWILYAMLDQQGVEFKPDKLAKLLRGVASESEISEALKGLVDAGEIVKDETTGEFKKSRNLTESAEDIPTALVRKLQSELMYLGLESLFRDSPAEREFGSATMTLTQEEFEELRFQLRKLRKLAQKDNAVKRMSGKGERVYQLNIQLFPVTETSK